VLCWCLLKQLLSLRYPFVGSPNQLWEFTTQGIWHLSGGLEQGKVLDVQMQEQGNPAAAGELLLHGGHGARNQRFVVSEPEGHVVSQQTDAQGRVLLLTALPPALPTDSSGGVAMRPALSPDTGDAMAAQEWVFVPLKDINEYHHQQQQETREEWDLEKKLHEKHQAKGRNRHNKHKHPTMDL